MDGRSSSVNRRENDVNGKVLPFNVEPVKTNDGRQPRTGRRRRVKLKEKMKFKPWEWKWRRWLLVCVLWLAQVFMAAAYSLVAPFFPTTAEKKGSNAVITGIIISASPLCLTICSPLFGYFLNKLGLKFTLVAGTFLVGGVFPLLGFLVDMPSGWAFITFAILMRIIQGVGWSMSTITTFSLLAQLFPNHVGTVTGFIEVGTGSGYSLGPPIGGILYEIGGFRLPFLGVGGIILLFVPLIMVLMKPTSCSSQTLPLRALFKLLSHYSILVLIYGNVVCFTAWTYFDPTFEPFLVQEFGLNKFSVGMLFLILSGVYVPMALVAGRLSDKLGTRKFIISGYFISGISLFFLGPADFISKPRLWIIIIALVVLGSGLPLAVVPVYSDLMKQAHTFYPKEDTSVLTNVVSGILTFSISLGAFVGPIVGGVLVEISDFPTSSVVIGEAMLGQGFLLLGMTLIDLVCQERKHVSVN